MCQRNNFDIKGLKSLSHKTLNVARSPNFRNVFFMSITSYKKQKAVHNVPPFLFNLYKPKIKTYLMESKYITFSPSTKNLGFVSSVRSNSISPLSSCL